MYNTWWTGRSDLMRGGITTDTKSTEKCWKTQTETTWDRTMNRKPVSMASPNRSQPPTICRGEAQCTASSPRAPCSRITMTPSTVLPETCQSIPKVRSKAPRRWVCSTPDPTRSLWRIDILMTPRQLPPQSLLSTSVQKLKRWWLVLSLDVIFQYNFRI